MSILQGVKAAEVLAMIEGPEDQFGDIVGTWDSRFVGQGKISQSLGRMAP